MKTLRTNVIKALAKFIAEVKIETRKAEQAKNRADMISIKDFMHAANLPSEELVKKMSSVWEMPNH